MLLLLGCSVDDDLSLGRGYACDAQAVDVVGGPQCAEGWRCDPSGRCVEDVPVDRASCVRSSDCEGGWVCGRDFQCRDPQVNAAYLCVDDADCGPSWRCGVAERCVDPALDAPRADAPHALLESVEQVSPPPPPDRVSITYRLFGNEGETVTQSRGATVQSYDTAPSSIPFEFAGPLSVNRPFTPIPERFAILPQAPRALAAVQGASLALLDEGLHHVASDGGVTLISADFAGMERMVVTTYSVPVVTGWNGSALAGARYVDGGVVAFELAPSSAALPSPGGELLDVGWLRRFGGTSDVIVAVTSVGVFVREANPSASWQPLSAGVLQHADPGCPVVQDGLRATAVAYANGETLALHAEGADGTIVSVDLRSVEGAAPGACQGAHPGRYFTVSSEACPVCPPGGRIVDASANTARCELLEDGGVVQRSYRNRGATGCAFSEAPEQVGTVPVQAYRDVRESTALVDPDGRVFAGGGIVGSTTVPLTLWRAPVDLLRVRGRLSALVSLPESLPNSTSQISGLEFSEAPGFGLARAGLFGSARPLPAGQELSPRFVLHPSARTVLDGRGWEDGGIPGVVAALDPNVNPQVGGGFRLPATLQAATRADGGTTLVVSSFDLLLAADLSASTGSAGTPPVLTPRLSPTPRLPIRDVVLLEADQVEGYALGDSALTYFRALSDQQWEGQPVPLPEGDPVSLVRVDGRAWLAYRDGRLFALPSRLQIAPSFASAHASDFATLCGRVYAATTAGLFRFEPHLAAGGAWILEPRFEAAATSPLEWTGARLFTGERELVWTGARGTVLRFTLSSCPD